MMHTFATPTCVHKQTKLVLWETALAGGPAKPMKFMWDGEMTQVDAGMPSSSFNPPFHVVTDFLPVLEYVNRAGVSVKVPIRCPAPAGTTYAPVIENVLSVHGKGQVLLDRTRDCMRAFGKQSGEECNVELKDGTKVPVRNEMVYVLSQGVVCWNSANGLGKGLNSKYQDPKCWLRLVSWLPSFKKWYHGTYGHLPSEECPRPDLFWPMGMIEPPNVMEPKNVELMKGVDPRNRLIQMKIPTWTKDQEAAVRAYRVRHPASTDQYSLWQVSVGMLQQPFVKFTDPADKEAFMKNLQDRKAKIDAMIDDGKTTVRQIDERLWRLWVWEEHSRQANYGWRPARPGDRVYDVRLENLIVQIGSIFIVFCNRQVVDGADGIGSYRTVIEAWVWVPGEGSWFLTEYRGIPSRL